MTTEKPSLSSYITIIMWYTLLTMMDSLGTPVYYRLKLGGGGGGGGHPPA